MKSYRQVSAGSGEKDPALPLNSEKVSRPPLPEIGRRLVQALERKFAATDVLFIGEQPKERNEP